RLRVLHPLLEVAVGSLVRSRVVDRLPLREQIDGAVDACRLRSVRGEVHHRHDERHADADPTQVLRGMLHGVILHSGGSMRRIWTLVAIFLLMARGAAVPHAADDLSVVPFRIHVADADLADLKARLARARLPDEIRGSGWTYGTSRAYLESLVRYWRDGFDWRAQERALNRFEQFTTTIDGLKIHFIHRRSKEPNALPLLITHGWPGS